MFLFLFFSALIVPNSVVAQEAYNETQVCYGVLGCFNNSAPYNNSFGDLPKSPEELGVRIWLFTRDNRSSHDVLNYTDASSLSDSKFDPTKMTKFIIHGFSSSFEKTHWILEMKDKLLNIGDFNVVAVDWSKGATFPDFPQATANLRLVATEVKLILDMMRNMGLDMSKVHLIGHSLGAHLSGYVGQLMGPNVIGRISGLDPAEPSFKGFTYVVKLDKEDAQFVDVIHTDGSDFDLLSGGFGLMDESGDVDIYVNGGQKQPGCKDGVDGLFGGGGSSLENSVACSHGRAHDIFLESIDTTCNFTAYPCSSFEKFENGECFNCDSGCTSVGFNSDQYSARGKFFVDTHHKPPFCGIPYHIKVYPDTAAVNTSGLIYVTLIGDINSTDYIPINSKNQHLNHLTEISSNVVFTIDVGTISSVQIKYERELGFLGGLFGSSSAPTFSIGGIEVLSPTTRQWSSSCRGTYQLRDRTPLTVITNSGRSADACTVVG
uniref:Lipase domain-containing protein n=1 Tax=Biomphalaria glabrata TaxID=6526 RepID=A0A2C9JEY5_BIOGL